MNACGNEHLNAGELELMLFGDLTADKEARITDHLDRCQVCRMSLEFAAGGPDVWVDAKELLSRDGLGHWCVAEANVEAGRLKDQLQHILAPSEHPHMIGRLATYEIAGIVGRGGTGIVLKAFDASLDRFVAIKVLAPELSITGAARERFQREARAAAAVAHENVIPIHAVSEFRGHSYIVMQYVPGSSLEQRIRLDGPLQVVEVLRIAMQVARALVAAHDQGLVHRDIKPANILLEEGVDRPVVTDFGLARVSNDATLTTSGAIAGTPHYMSPEQAEGKGLDARSDLFSLGSAMYAMCLGRPPFRSETILGVLRRVSEDNPSSIRKDNPNVPEWLEAFIFKLLAKDPELRFETAADVVAVLSDELAYLQCPTARSTPNRGWWRRKHNWARRLLATCLVLAALCSLCVVAVFWSPGHPKTTSDSRDTHVDGPSLSTTNSPLMDTVQWDSELSAAMQTARQLEDAWRLDISPPHQSHLDVEANAIGEHLSHLEAEEP